MAGSAPISATLAELLAAEAIGDIGRGERARLDELLSRDAVPDRDQMMMAAGLVQLALLKNDPRAQARMPDSLRARLAIQADAWQAGRRAAVPAPVVNLDVARRRRQLQAESGSNLPPSWWRTKSAAGWYVAAALALVFVTARLGPDPATAPATVSVQAQRAALVREAPDVVTAPWGPSTEPAYENARGDVVWSDARQEGYLRISGLPVNERTKAQYQLWVVDASRDTYPVDGGVFDITSNGELVIPVHAKLRVNRPAAFAVTLEQPGGVVVSDGPMLLVAAAGG
jgi:hypothetical protein